MHSGAGADLARQLLADAEGAHQAGCQRAATEADAVQVGRAIARSLLKCAVRSLTGGGRSPRYHPGCVRPGRDRRRDERRHGLPRERRGGRPPVGRPHRPGRAHCGGPPCRGRGRDHLDHGFLRGLRARGPGSSGPPSDGAGRGGHVEYAEFSCTYAGESLVQTVARCEPACRSMVTVASRPDRSTCSRGAPGARRTADPDAVHRDVDRVGSNARGVVPTAASTLPQLGSCAEQRALEAGCCARPTADLDRVVLGGAPTTSMATSSSRPRRRRAAARRGRRTPASRAAVELAAVGVTPDAPLASSSTVSLVDMQPSESIRSKVTRGRGAQRRVERRRRRRRIGGEHARAWWPAPGRACRRPWPCRRPSSRRRSTTACLGHRVGGPDRLGGVAGRRRAEQRGDGRVDAGAAAVHRQPLADQAGRADRDVAGADAERRGRRARPWRGCRRSPPDRCTRWRRRSSARRRAPGRRRAPAATTAPARPSPGCAVNTPAAAWCGPSLTTSATSGAPDALSPAATPAARKPGGGGDAHGATPFDGQAGGLGQAEHEVGVLHRLAGRALAEVVDRADDDDPAGVARRRPPAGGTVFDAERRRGVRPAARRAARARTARRRRPRRSASCTAPAGDAAGRPRRARREDAARHRRQHRRERQRDRSPPRRRCSISGTCWCAADLVRRQLAHHLAGRAGAPRAVRPAPVVPLARRTTTSSGSTSPAASSGASARSTAAA